LQDSKTGCDVADVLFRVAAVVTAVPPLCAGQYSQDVESSSVRRQWTVSVEPERHGAREHAQCRGPAAVRLDLARNGLAYTTACLSFRRRGHFSCTFYYFLSYKCDDFERIINKAVVLSVTVRHLKFLPSVELEAGSSGGTA